MPRASRESRAAGPRLDRLARQLITVHVSLGVCSGLGIGGVMSIWLGFGGWALGAAFLAWVVSAAHVARCTYRAGWYAHAADERARDYGAWMAWTVDGDGVPVAPPTMGHLTVDPLAAPHNIGDVGAE